MWRMNILYLHTLILFVIITANAKKFHEYFQFALLKRFINFLPRVDI